VKFEVKAASGKRFL